MPDIVAMLPTLEDARLANLLANARRLSGDGTDKQKARAGEMLTAIEAECAKRAAAGAAAKPKRAAPRRKADSPGREG